MKTSNAGKKLTAEEKIVRGLENFAAAMESDDELTTQFTCRKVKMNVQSHAYTPEMVKSVRRELGLSQSLFAQFLGASKSWVQAWERGERKPPALACRFMDEIRNDPVLFRKRFLKLATPVGQK